jgi:Zn-dependent alcohol dehydrogenase
MGARLAGADPIIAVDLDPAKLDRARDLGATHVVHADEQDVVEAVLAVEPDGVEWAIEAVGRAETLVQSIMCLRPGGTTVAVGIARVGATVEVPINELVQRQKRVVGSLYGSSTPQLDLPRLYRLYLSGRLPLDRLLGEERPARRGQRGLCRAGFGRRGARRSDPRVTGPGGGGARAGDRYNSTVRREAQIARFCGLFSSVSRPV